MLRSVKMVIYLLTLKSCLCQRRITNGSIVKNPEDARFMAYLVPSLENKKDTWATVNDDWICGGCLIHPSLILTSASCIQEARYIYAVVGYRNYVKPAKLNQDLCTKHMKQKIVSYCNSKKLPNNNRYSGYTWLQEDIAVARTESPFDYYDSNFIKYCHYLPVSIRLNYNAQFESWPLPAVSYGWGHDKYYRADNHPGNYNSEVLKYSTSITNTAEQCKSRFKEEFVKNEIGKSLLCADTPGFIFSNGSLMNPSNSTNKECRRSGRNVEDIMETNETENCLVGIHRTRRYGICQNDHGSPLVRWLGGQPIVIGVAVGFQVNEHMECVGPYLYSRLSCQSQFLSCVMRAQNTTQDNRRSYSYCDDPPSIRGFDIKTTEFLWDKEDAEE